MVVVHMKKRGNVLLSSHQNDRFIPWKKTRFLRSFPLGGKSRAALMIDAKGAPRFFILDTHALLDVLSRIDDALVDRLSPEEYYAKEANPAGWLIDEIESRLPLKKGYAASLKQAIKEAQEEGWIPFSPNEMTLD